MHFLNKFSLDNDVILVLLKLGHKLIAPEDIDLRSLINILSNMYDIKAAKFMYPDGTCSSNRIRF